MLSVVVVDMVVTASASGPTFRDTGAFLVGPNSLETMSNVKDGLDFPTVII